ncbi:velvet factor-domain-containing protein [Polychytrium aggregatum]|uniref:velvet factor-domain-containing protein n=1 Tax=Polychytrium aggregatum TaxID=110093 RepID=UPI0022FED235|nr:velvet factor-domain-containing protein [Polychytrium aggregatum]KAI9204628.1 velvet factor-domain-containing protein [Polychytrium aggregatum]
MHPLFATNRTYVLNVIQQPNRAKSGSLDTLTDPKPVDPPVILQLSTRASEERVLRSPVDMPESATFVVHAKLWAETRDEESLEGEPQFRREETIPSSSASSRRPSRDALALRQIQSQRQTPRSFAQPAGDESSEALPATLAFGTLVSHSLFLTDMEGDPGVFFVFSDLYVRMEGRFRLKFFLTDLQQSEESGVGGQCLATAISQPFTSYGWKQFPGMQREYPWMLNSLVSPNESLGASLQPGCWLLWLWLWLWFWLRLCTGCGAGALRRCR